MRTTVHTGESRSIDQSSVFWLVITIGLTFISVLIPHLIAPGYYFYDDVRHYFMVSIHDVGSRLMQGDWPILSLRSAYSGNLIGEGQLSLFNPLTLILSMLISQITDLEMGALIYAGIHLIALASGVFLLGRRLAISPPLAALCGFAFATTSMNTYWYASAWWPALTTNTWLVWAISAWLVVLEERRFFFAAVIVTSWVFSGGWPHGSIALFLVLTVLVIRQVSTDGFNFVQRTVIAGIIASIIFSLPALVPLAVHVAESSRGIGLSHSGALSATMDSLLSLSWPSYLSALPIFWGHRNTQPDFYAAWFILPLLLIHRSAIPRYWRERDTYFRLLITLGCFFAVLSMGPEVIGPMRWPIRFVPYFHLFILLAIVKLADNVHEKKCSFLELAILWGICFLLCWQQLPNYPLIHASYVLVGFLGSYLYLNRRTIQSRTFLLILITLLIFSSIHLLWC